MTAIRSLEKALEIKAAIEALLGEDVGGVGVGGGDSREGEAWRGHSLGFGSQL